MGEFIYQGKNILKPAPFKTSIGDRSVDEKKQMTKLNLMMIGSKVLLIPSSSLENLHFLLQNSLILDKSLNQTAPANHLNAALRSDSNYWREI